MHDEDEELPEPIPAYQAWLNSYTQEVSQLDLIEFAAERRKDYHHSSSAYPDYLDYVEEWEWHAKDQISQLLSTVIKQYGSRGLRLKCDCGVIHTMTTYAKKHLGDMIVDHPTESMHSSCWYRTFEKVIDNVFKNVRKGHIRLPDPIEHMLTRLTCWKLASQGNTPQLLPYDAFKAIWWNKSMKGVYEGEARRLYQQLMLKDKEMVSQMKERMVPTSDKEGEVLLHYPQSDHGLHALKSALGKDFTTVLGWMNRMRRKLNHYERIRPEDVSEKEATCTMCKERKYRSRLSPQAIYYAPPGAGKTTAQNNELIVGFDTDWCGVGLTWEDYSPILKMNIPIITNQHNVFIGCGLKVIGIVRNDIRLDARGRPLAYADELLRVAKDQWRNIAILGDRTQYLSEIASTLISFAILQTMVANYAINLKPFYANESDAEWTVAFPKLLKKSRQKEMNQRRDQAETLEL